MYTLLNRSKNDSKGILSLSQDGTLYSNTKDKADILNSQFQSVFTPKTPLSLSKLAQMTVQDQIDVGKINPQSVPAGCLNNQPVMPDIHLSEAGILKLLHDLNQNKAAGPELKPLVLRELREVIAPMVGSYSRDQSIQDGCLNSGVMQMYVPCSKKVTRPLPQTTGPSLWLVYYAKSWTYSCIKPGRPPNSHNLLYDLQHGFRAKRSCKTQLVCLCWGFTAQSTQWGHVERGQFT